MNKDEALKRLTALENEAKELRKVIEAPEPAPSLITMPAFRESYGVINIDRDGINGVGAVRETKEDSHYTLPIVFQTRQLAKDYAAALDTFLLLRHQLGTVPPIDGAIQYGIGCSNLEIDVIVETFSKLQYKLSHLSPSFAKYNDAQKAIIVVGTENIIHMFKTFHHFK